MAYASPNSRNGKTATLTAVALLHIAGITALVTGLTVSWTPHVDPPLSGAQIPLDPLPLPEPVDQTKPKTPIADPLTSAPVPLVDLTPRSGPLVLPSFTPPAIGDPGPLVIDPPSPSPSPRFSPKSAMPLGRPGSWVSPNDFPTTDLRLGHTGVTRFRLGIGSDGRVTSCTITASSGWPGLDSATCARLTQRARFTPASDESGAKVAGSFASSVRWEIPA